MRFQRRDWAFERVAWGLLSLLVLAALLGLFSRGFLSEATASDPDGSLVVAYERFQRFDTASSVEIRIAAAATRGDAVELRLRGPLLRAQQIQGLSPEPIEARLAEDGWVLRFPVGDRGAPSLVRMEVRPEALAWVEGEVSVEGRPPARVRSFVYP